MLYTLLQMFGRRFGGSTLVNGMCHINLLHNHVTSDKMCLRDWWKQPYMDKHAHRFIYQSF